METVAYLIIPTVFFAAIIIWAFFWSLKNDQLDDPQGNAERILFDDEDK
jgi:cbb3-type cytochrome oxidase maturation protein